MQAQSGILTRGRIGLLRLSPALMSPVSAGGPRRATLYHPASVVSSPSSPSLQQAEESLSTHGTSDTISTVPNPIKPQCNDVEIRVK